MTLTIDDVIALRANCTVYNATDQTNIDDFPTIVNCTVYNATDD